MEVTGLFAFTIFSWFISRQPTIDQKPHCCNWWSWILGLSSSLSITSFLWVRATEDAFRTERTWERGLETWMETFNVKSDFGRMCHSLFSCEMFLNFREVPLFCILACCHCTCSETFLYLQRASIHSLSRQALRYVSNCWTNDKSSTLVTIRSSFVAMSITASTRKTLCPEACQDKFSSF